MFRGDLDHRPSSVDANFKAAKASVLAGWRNPVMRVIIAAAIAAGCSPRDSANMSLYCADPDTFESSKHLHLRINGLDRIMPGESITIKIEEQDGSAVEFMPEARSNPYDAHISNLIKRGQTFNVSIRHGDTLPGEHRDNPVLYEQTLTHALDDC